MKKILIMLLVLMLASGCAKVEEVQTEYTNDLATVIDDEVKSYVIKDADGNVVERCELDTEYLIEYTLSTDKNLKIKLTMVDTTAPLITINEDALNVEAQTEIGELFSVIDNYDQDVVVVQDNQVDTNNLGDVVINVKATDSKGNESNEVINVTVQDTTVPTLEILKETFSYNVGYKAAKFETGAKGFDAVDGELEITIEGDWNSSKAGKYDLYYVATDKSGNRATAPFSVTYKKVNKPTVDTGNSNSGASDWNSGSGSTGNGGGSSDDWNSGNTDGDSSDGGNSGSGNNDNTGGGSDPNILCAGGRDPSKPCDVYVGNTDGAHELFQGDDENMTACKARGESLLGDATENDWGSYFCSSMSRNDYKHWGSGLMMGDSGQ